ncbi:MAG: CusA/CzcA family heavy metal efflux RND transporter [Dysgonamonadaceae bacterium]|jgi:cobalt-zinc-cadmium resistance protein CzcA|nr:CusA/CzcA family heavy metal efflux RND transporter [Dysgonamonadaceae bacterium]
MHKFIQNIVAFSLRHHVLVLFMSALLLVAGIIAYRSMPIEAYPDVTNTRARIITQWPGRSAEEVEKFITLPMMRVMNTIPRKTDVRSVSLFGLSVVTVLFEDDVDDFFAQQSAANRLMGLDLPEDAEAEIEPPSGATGEIFRYVLRSSLPIREITAIDEWVVQRELLSVPGVADVVSFGGEEKIYEIRVNPIKLHNYELTPLEVYEAIENSNINVGGDIIQKGSQAYVVRGIGLLESIEDIENILIEVKGSTPIRVKQVAEVVVSSKPRLGQVGLDDDDDLVQGIIVMLRGQNPSEVIKGIRAKIDDLNDHILPSDVRIEPFIDRTTLVDATVNTVTKNLLIGIVLVTCVVFMFLFNWRTTLITAIVIPLSFLFAIIMLRIQGLPANLISMGALDFGLLLEGTLVIVERVFVELNKKTQMLGADRYRSIIKAGIIKRSAGNVAPFIFFAQMTTIVALIPIFSFQQVEGKMFSPLAFTLGWALLGSLILCLTLVPVMCKILLTKPVYERKNIFSSALIGFIQWVYQISAAFKRTTIVAFCILLTICVIGFMNYGTEFIPKINEGAVYVRATLPNSINLDEAVRYTREMKAKIRTFDEVQFVLSQTGRPNDGTDPTGFFNIEFHIELKPESKWTRRISKDALIDELQATLDIYPGIDFGFSQPIQDNVEEYVAGVKSSLVIKIFGHDLFQLEDLADKAADAIRDVRGIEDVLVYRSVGLPELQIKPQEWKMAQHAVSMADAQAVIEMAIGGKAVTTFYENERTFDVMLRFEQQFRNNEQTIGNILIPTMDDKQVPLKEIADIEFVTGPAFIYREGGGRYVGVGFSVRGRDLGGAIAEAQERVETLLATSLRSENRLVWAGEFESKERATRRLAMIVPVALLLILFLLYMNFGTVKDTLIASAAFPFAFVGGFLALWVTGTVFGISAGIGFTILFGVSATDSIILVGVMKSNLRKMRDIKQAIASAVATRARPVLMIALMGSLGLLPAAISQGMGSEVQKPIAIIIVIGIIIQTIFSFMVLPQIFYFVYKKKEK